ncbi:hypothetical protein [Streptomyces goshikiensis]
MRCRLLEWLQQLKVRELAVTGVMWLVKIAAAGLVSAAATKLVDTMW